VPVVAISGHGRTNGVTNIRLNHEHAALAALQHLRELGHREIAVLKGQPFSSDTAVRWRTIQQAARTLELAIDERLVIQLQGDRPLAELGHNATAKLLQSGVPFTAIFAFNDLSGFGAIGALREAGLRVPDDVSVVGFDDIQSAASHNPPLTTIRQPLRQMGEVAAETLVARIVAGARARYVRTIQVEPELVVRGSTGPCRT